MLNVLVIQLGLCFWFHKFHHINTPTNKKHTSPPSTRFYCCQPSRKIMKFFPISAIVTTTSLLLFTLIGQQKQLVAAQTAASQFYQPVVPSTNDPFVLMRFIFNNGNPPDATTYCTDDDYYKVMEVFPLSMRGRLRELRGSNGTVQEVMSVSNNSTTRELYPLMCANACSGLVAGTCRATRCVGYRRNLAVTSAQAAALCSSTMDSLNWALNDLIAFKQVSPVCKSFIQIAKRQTYCALCYP